MIVLSHPTGNAPVRNALQALFEAGMLSCFCTSLALSADSRLLNLPLPLIAKKELLRRTHNLPSSHIQSRPTLEIFRLTGQQLLGSRFGSGPIDRVYKTVDKLTAKVTDEKHPRGIYAYEDGALESFIHAETLGIHRFYELPIAYWKVLHRVLKEQTEKYPEWERTMEFSRDSKEKCVRKDKELELADSIACPSTFVRDSIPERFRHKCSLIPYGAPPPKRNDKPHQVNKPLKILFAGSMSQRKGLADLFHAIRLLDTRHIELIVMGKLRAPIEFYKKQLPHFTYAPPRSHARVLELMQSCDLFCLPSIIEGRALVQLEALSSGLPIIITPNTGGSDLIEEGKTGFLIPPNNSNAIADKIEWLLTHRESIQSMKEAAWDKAESTSWLQYRTKFIHLIRKKLELP